MEKNNIYAGETSISINIFDMICKQSRKTSNNYLKLHGRPMRRKPIKRPQENVIVIGMTGKGMSFTDKLQTLRQLGCAGSGMSRHIIRPEISKEE